MSEMAILTPIINDAFGILRKILAASHCDATRSKNEIMPERQVNVYACGESYAPKTMGTASKSRRPKQ